MARQVQGRYSRALGRFYKRRGTQEINGVKNQEEITRRLEDNDGVHQNFIISSSSFLFSFYSC